MGVCNCSMFCCTLLYVHSSIAIILMGKRELVALLNLSSWCLVMVEWLFLAVPWGCLRFVIVVVPDHTHLLFLNCIFYELYSSLFYTVHLQHSRHGRIQNFLGKSQVTICFLRNTAWYGAPRTRVQLPLGSRARFVRPSVKYVDE